MKFPALPLSLGTSLLTLVLAASLPAQDPVQPAPVNPGAPAGTTEENIHPALKHLSKAQRDTLVAHLKRASEYVRGVRTHECITECQSAINLAPEFYPSYNLQGAAYTKLRDFAKARAAFQKASALEPRAFDVKFNLAEMDFVEKKFGDARSAFQKLIDENPKLPKATYDLLLYKTAVCSLKLGETDAAQKVADSFDYLDDSPAYYYCRAAIAFAKEKPGEAQSWIRSAGGIFKPVQNQNYIDSLIEAGWVQALGSGVEVEGAVGSAPEPTPSPTPAPVPAVPDAAPAPVPSTPEAAPAPAPAPIEPAPVPAPAPSIPTVPTVPNTN